MSARGLRPSSMAMSLILRALGVSRPVVCSLVGGMIKLPSLSRLRLLSVLWMLTFGDDGIGSVTMMVAGLPRLGLTFRIDVTVRRFEIIFSSLPLEASRC